VDNDYAIDRFRGGEQDDIAVALRIALSRYLARLLRVHESTFLIFDEIFGSQDEEKRNNLLTALRTQESRFPQIFLISPVAGMQGEFANTLVIELISDQSGRIRVAE
jgi:exonuclease SbcC